MFITFGYLVIELYNWYARRKNPDMRFLQLLRDHVKKGSILIRAVSQAQDDAQRLSNLLASQSIHNQTVLTTERRKQILSVAPKVSFIHCHFNSTVLGGTRLIPKLFVVHGLVFCFVMQHRLDEDQCQGSQVSLLPKQLERNLLKK